MAAGLRAGYTGAGSEAACAVAEAAVAATGNRICGGKQFLNKKTRNGGKHDDADKR
jgi:hypothetical protein